MSLYEQLEDKYLDADLLRQRRLRRTDAARVSHEQRAWTAPDGDPRTVYEADRDKILYSSAFRRLQQITQVLSPIEGHALHNRQNHSYKVANIGEALAKRLWLRAVSLVEGGDDFGIATIAEFGGLHPMAVSAGALAHDVGHPPFAHAGEKTLQDLLEGDRQHWLTGRAARKFESATCEDSFEGNAQSLRALVSLSHLLPSSPGLPLSLASMNAFQKYPWPREENSKKWGYYSFEKGEVETCRGYLAHLGRRRSLEAELVDIADDISFAVHDLEDFIRTRMIDFQYLRQQGNSGPDRTDLRADAERSLVQDDHRFAWMQDAPGSGHFEKGVEYCTATTDWSSVLDEADSFIFSRLPDFESGDTADRRYTPTTKNRRRLRGFGSDMIKELLESVEFCSKRGATLTDRGRALVALLQAIVKRNVIQTSEMDRAQQPQRKIVERLMATWTDELSAAQPNWNLFPMRNHEELRGAIEEGEEKLLRSVVDTLASLTEQEAVYYDSMLHYGGPSFYSFPRS